jgi:hypothetical protein
VFVSRGRKGFEILEYSAAQEVAPIAGHGVLSGRLPLPSFGQHFRFRGRSVTPNFDAG